MSKNIYAGISEAHPKYGQIMGPVIGFKCWDDTILAEDAEARSERGEDPFVLNPDYVPNAGMTLSNSNTSMLFEIIGLPLVDDDPTHMLIEDVHRAALRGLNGHAVHYSAPQSIAVGQGGCSIVSNGVPDGYVAARLEELLAIIVEGRKRGATHICIC